jgi:hypothetical protein
MKHKFISETEKSVWGMGSGEWGIGNKEFKQMGEPEV